MRRFKKILSVCVGAICCLSLPVPVSAKAVSKDLPLVTPAVEISDTGDTQPIHKPVVRIMKATSVKTVDENANERAHIVDVAENWGITVSSYNDCAKWVWSVLQSAGFENVPHWSGARYWEHFASEKYADSSKIPVGAIVIGTGRNSDVSGTGYYYGHVGICVKNDGDEILIRDCIGPGSSGVHTQTLDEWISWQTDAYLGYDYHDPGFVGWIYYPDLERTGADFTY